MQYFLGDSPEVAFAFWTGAFTLVLAIVMFMSIIVMNWAVVRREHAHEQQLQRWRKFLNRALVEGTGRIPYLEPYEVSDFAEVWNDMHESMPERHASLRKIGEKLELSSAARKLLHKGHHQRAMAISALGHQGDLDDFDQIAPFLNDKSPIISLCAARALSQIDAARAMDLFVPALLPRDDWPAGTVASIFKENRSTSAVTALSNAALRANDNTAARLVRFLADTDAERASPVIRELLESDVDDHVISTCLQVITDRADLDRVRDLLRHPRWHVRMHAASALERIGDISDEQRLIPLLSDSQWWVRYRAAQAIRTLVGNERQGTYQLDDVHQDDFSRQIIQQVMAEPARKGTA